MLLQSYFMPQLPFFRMKIIFQWNFTVRKIVFWNYDFDCFIKIDKFALDKYMYNCLTLKTNKENVLKSLRYLAAIEIDGDCSYMFGCGECRGLFLYYFIFVYFQVLKFCKTKPDIICLLRLYWNSEFGIDDMFK